MNRDPTNQHHPSSLEAISRWVAAQARFGFADLHGHAIGQNYRIAIGKKYPKKLVRRIPFSHPSTPHTISSLTPVQDALSPFVFVFYPPVPKSDFPSGLPARGKRIDLLLHPHPPCLMHCALRSTVPIEKKGASKRFTF